MDVEDHDADHAPARTEPALPADALATIERSMAMTNGSGRGPRSMVRRLGPLTSILVLGVVAALGFIGGVQVQKHQGGTGQVATAGPGGAGTGAAAAARAAAAAAGATSTIADAAPSEAAGPSSSLPAGAGARPGAAARAGAGGAGPAGPAGAAGAGGAGAAAAGRPGALAAGAATAGQVKLIDGNNIYVTDATGNVVKVVTTDSSRFTKTGAGSIQDVRPGDTIVVQGQKGADGIVTAIAVANSGNAGTP